MRLLLDTHALIWWLTDNPRLSGPARSGIADPANDVLASPASGYEIANKERLGKLGSGIASDHGRPCERRASASFLSTSSTRLWQARCPDPIVIRGTG